MTDTERILFDLDLQNKLQWWADVKKWIELLRAERAKKAVKQ